MAMNRTGAPFNVALTNIDQRQKRPVPKAFLIVGGLLALAGLIGGAAKFAEDRQLGNPLLHDERAGIGSDENLSDYSVRWIVTADVHWDHAFEEKNTVKFLGADLTLAKPPLKRTDAPQYAKECGKTPDRYIDANVELHFPDGTQASSRALELCMVEDSHVTTTWRITAPEHGYGTYKVRGTGYDHEWHWCWKIACQEVTPVPFEFEVRLTRGDWTDWIPR